MTQYKSALCFHCEASMPPLTCSMGHTHTGEADGQKCQDDGEALQQVDGNTDRWAVGLKCRFERLKLQHQAKVFPSISDKGSYPKQITE